MTGASADAEHQLRVICGPTAAGKSAIAMWLASREPSTIISADSRQIYRGFDVGTGKPTAEERARVHHDGVDVVEPSARYSAAAWATSATEWIHEARARGTTPLVVGGTGLYMRALFEGLFDEPPLDSMQRARLASVTGAMKLAELRRWASVLDPVRAHLGRSQLERVVEMALLTGRRMSDLHREQATKPVCRPRYLLVDPGPALAGRIAARIDHMLDHGWPEEVQRLMESVPPDASAWKATGYDAVRDLVCGSLTRAAARESILVATRQYAKRQRTWFRHQLPADRVTRVDPLDHAWTTTVEQWFEGVPGSTTSSI